jgi:sestrin
MLKTFDISTNQLTIYYNYIKDLNKLYSILSHKNPQYDDILSIIQKIEKYNSELNKDYIDSINIRINLIESESIYIIQSNFFSYLSQNFFFDTEEDRKEEIEKMLKTNNTLKRQSSYIINHQSIYNNSDDNIEDTLKENLKRMRRFLYFEHYFIWYKNYMSIYEKTVNFTFKKNSSLPIQWKYYLALMACSTMKNEYLTRLFEEEFLDNDGDINWLILGLNVVPNKLKQLANLNNIIAHQPWNIKIEELNKLKNILNISELTEACLILMEFQKMSLLEELVEFKKFNNENEIHRKRSKDMTEKIDLIKQEQILNIINEIKKEEDKKKEEEFDEENELNDKDTSDTSYKINDLYSLKQSSFNSVDSWEKGEKNVSDENLCNNIYNKYLSEDYDKIAFKGPNKNVFLTSFEYNWRDHGYYNLKNYAPNLINWINDEIKYIFELTSNSSELKKINSSLNSKYVKEAIIRYIEKLYGYYHEDYKYKNITKLLCDNVNYTKYLKKFVCYPKDVSLSDFCEMNSIFLHEEIMHIILLIVNVKMRVQLIYFSKAIDELMKNNQQ